MNTLIDYDYTYQSANNNSVSNEVLPIFEELYEAKLIKIISNV